MRVVSLRFPGNFEDAFLYMGRLITITENHSVRVYDMENIVNKLQEDETLVDAPTLLFFRNDWIIKERFRHRFNDKTRKEVFIKAIERMESEPIYIDENFIKPVEWDLNIAADIMLDLNIYNGRLYIGTNKGLYHIDLDWEAENTTPISEAKKRLDAKCIHTTAKFGTVNASCGSEGWFSFLDDFDLGISNSLRERQKHIPEYSMRTAWLDFDVVNYPTNVEPTLFYTIRNTIQEELIESKRTFDQESWIVIDLLEDTEYSLNTLFNNLKSDQRFSPEDLQFVYNSSQALFLSTYDGKLFTLGLKRSSSASSSANPTISYDNKYEGLQSLVSSIHTLSIGDKPGLVLETDKQILLFANRRFIPIFDNEVISIRTFSRSQHYKNVISVTTSNEVVLIAVFDEEAY